MRGSPVALLGVCVCALALAAATLGATTTQHSGLATNLGVAHSEATLPGTARPHPTARLAAAAATPAILAPAVVVAPAAPVPSAVPDVAYHVPILMYHRIVPPAEAGDSLPSMVTAPDLFRAQLRELHGAGWRTITLEQLARAMRSGAPVPPRTFAITIDDGWNDGYTHAFPMMRDYGYNATFFVITSRIGVGDFLSKRQLLALQAAGNEIGNHTMTHVKLTTLDFDHAAAEIDGASTALARIIGHRPVSLSYPKSGVEPWVVAAAGQCAGIQIAVTTFAGPTESWRTRLETPRVRTDDTTSGAALLARLQAIR